MAKKSAVKHHFPRKNLRTRQDWLNWGKQPVDPPITNNEYGKLLAEIGRAEEAHFRPLCEAFGFGPRAGAGDMETVLFWTSIPPEMREELWAMFPETIRAQKETLTAAKEALTAVRGAIPKLGAAVRQTFDRKNGQIARLDAKVMELQRKVRMRSRRRNRPRTETKALTVLQAETVQLYSDCNGNWAEMARRIGKDQKTLRQHYEAALGKVGVRFTLASAKQRSRAQRQLEAAGRAMNRLPAGKRGEVLEEASERRLPTDSRPGYKGNE